MTRLLTSSSANGAGHLNFSFRKSTGGLLRRYRAPRSERARERDANA